MSNAQRPKWMTDRQEQIARLQIEEHYEANGKVNIKEILQGFDRPTNGSGHNFIAAICDEKGYRRVRSKMAGPNATEAIESIVFEMIGIKDRIAILIEKIEELYP